MRFFVTDEAQAEEVRSYFNAFHDGFIRRVGLVSGDRFEPDGSQVMTGELEIEIEVAHHNYDAAKGTGQVVRSRFAGVRDVALDFSGKAEEWSILDLSFAAAAGTGEPGAPGRLECRLSWEVHDAVRGWTPVEKVLFTFERATIEVAD